MFESYDDILTLQEAADALRISVSHAYKLIRNNEIHAYKDGKDWKIPKISLTDFITNRINKTFSV